MPLTCFCPGFWLKPTELPTFAFLEDFPKSEDNSKQTKLNQTKTHTRGRMSVSGCCLEYSNVMAVP